MSVPTLCGSTSGSACCNALPVYCYGRAHWFIMRAVNSHSGREEVCDNYVLRSARHVPTS